MEDPLIFTVAEVADKLGCSVHKVYRRIARGDIKSTQVKARQLQYRVSAADLDTYINAGGADVLSDPETPTDMLRVPEVARMTSFSVETVRRMCYTGRLPYIKGAGDSGHLRIPRKAVEEFLAIR